MHCRLPTKAVLLPDERCSTLLCMGVVECSIGRHTYSHCLDVTHAQNTVPRPVSSSYVTDVPAANRRVYTCPVRSAAPRGSPSGRPNVSFQPLQPRNMPATTQQTVSPRHESQACTSQAVARRGHTETETQRHRDRDNHTAALTFSHDDKELCDVVHGALPRKRRRRSGRRVLITEAHTDVLQVSVGKRSVQGGQQRGHALAA